MAAVNVMEVYAGVIAVLRADAAVQTALGNPARIAMRVEPGTVIPYALMSGIPEGRYSGGLGGKWIRAVGIQFNIYDNDTTCTRVAAAMKAIMDVMDQLPGSFSVVNAKLGSCVPVFDAENDVAMAVCSWRLSVEQTT